MPKPKWWNSQWTLLLVITLALLAWGIFHAAGAYFGGFGNENLQHDFRRSLVVLGCMVLFPGRLVVADADGKNERLANRPAAVNEEHVELRSSSDTKRRSITADCTDGRG